MTNTELAEHVKQLQGEMLTLIEATFPDREQRTAQKKIVNRIFGRKLFEIFEGRKGQ